jgi:hypothetical protein
MEKIKYHCIDCVACLDGDNITYKCKFDNQELKFDIETKQPCHRFIPKEYIKSLNYDAR